MKDEKTWFDNPCPLDGAPVMVAIDHTNEPTMFVTCWGATVITVHRNKMLQYDLSGKSQVARYIDGIRKNQDQTAWFRFDKAEHGNMSLGEIYDMASTAGSLITRKPRDFETLHLGGNEHYNAGGLNMGSDSSNTEDDLAAMLGIDGDSSQTPVDEADFSGIVKEEEPSNGAPHRQRRPTLVSPQDYLKQIS